MYENEVWKDLPNYEGYYQVSDLGRAKSLSRQMWNGKAYWYSKEIILKQQIGTTGYYNIRLSKYNITKTTKVHQMIAMSFLGHKPDGTNKLVIDHKNNNKLDNTLENLQLITHRLNISKDKKNKSSIYTGVSFVKLRNKWKSQIRLNGAVFVLGYFDNEEIASETYKNALKEIESGIEIKFNKKIKNI
jgi:hypothetical protein